MTWICQLSQARVSRGEKLLLDDVTLTVPPGAKIGVVGPNGAGKSTLLKVMAGLVQPANGEVSLAPGTTVGILLQEPRLDDNSTVLGSIDQTVAETRALLARYDEFTQRLVEEFSEELLGRLGHLQDELDNRNAWTLDSQIQQAMDALRCPPANAAVGTLSGGERRRVALCTLLLQQPDLLLLDEPTNHLDTDSVAWLEQHLQHYHGTVVAVTHDRYFLNTAADWILELDRGHAYPYEGNYTTYLETKQARMRVVGHKDAKRRRLLQQELDWVRSSPSGRQAKSRARLQRYEQMAADAEMTKTLDFEEIRIPPGPRLGAFVLDVRGVGKVFGDRVVIRDLSFSVPRNGIVGVLGPNGVGKTTLFSMLAGRQQPDTGTIRVGDSVKIAYVDQDRAQMDPDRTAWDLVSGGQTFLTVGKLVIPSRAYLAAFGFKGHDQQKPARLFSGGERGRLNLALTLTHGGNVLLLDEPTNDLDVESLASLENALLEFPGSALITAHDRWFLDRVATHILAWEGTIEDPGRWFWFEANLAGYLANRIDRLGPEAARPHRVTYRKLTRT